MIIIVAFFFLFLSFLFSLIFLVQFIILFILFTLLWFLFIVLILIIESIYKFIFFFMFIFSIIPFTVILPIFLPLLVSTVMVTELFKVVVFDFFYDSKDAECKIEDEKHEDECLQKDGVDIEWFCKSSGSWQISNIGYTFIGSQEKLRQRHHFSILEVLIQIDIIKLTSNKSFQLEKTSFFFNCKTDSGPAINK